MAKLTSDDKAALNAAFDARDSVRTATDSDRVSLQLRLPRDLHARMTARAKGNERSLNAELIAAARFVLASDAPSTDPRLAWFDEAREEDAQWRESDDSYGGLRRE